MVHMPVLNTPQVDWVLTRLPRRAQPMPPIYQPEIAARALGYAATHPDRREYWVGGSSVGTIIGNKLAAGLLDRYLARTGHAAQQTNERPEPDPPSNLWEPADRTRDFGAHGRFDESSVDRSYQLAISQHRVLTAGAMIGVTAAGILGAVVARLCRK